MRIALFLLLALLLPRPGLAATPASSPAAASASGSGASAAAPISAAQAQQVLEVLQNDQKRAQFVAVLQNMARALPAAAAPAGPLASNGLIGEALTDSSRWARNAAGQVSQTIDAVNDFPLLFRWVRHVSGDPATRESLIQTAWKLVLVLAAGLAVELIVARALSRPFKVVAARAAARQLAHERGRPVETPATAEEPPAPPVRAGADGGTLTEHDCTGAADEEREEDREEPHDAAVSDTAAVGADGVTATLPPHERRRRRQHFRAATRLLRRSPYVAARTVLDLVPIMAFFLTTTLLLGTPIGDPEQSRIICLLVVQAYIVARLVVGAGRVAVDPEHRALRLLDLSDSASAFLLTWLRRIVAVIATGATIAHVGAALGLYSAAEDTVIKLTALVVHLLLVVVVLRSRRRVAAWIRPKTPRPGMWAAYRVRIAAIWHWFAIFYIVALWVVYAIEVQNGFNQLLRLFLLTIVTVAASRIVSVVTLGGLDRAFRLAPGRAAELPWLESRLARYYPPARALFLFVMTVATVIVLLQVWGLDTIGWLMRGDLGGRFASAGGTVAITCLIALLVWEAANSGVERHLATLAAGEHFARSARLRTLLPLLRTTLLVIILLIVGLTALSEIGVNIAPLLAGAGVVGVAVGFGSQTLVKDFITGLFLLLENTMQVGDTVSLAGVTGTVENLSIRTIRLRALDGSVHIVPFSAVTSVTNQTRDFAYAVLDVPIGLNEPPDRVAGLLRDIAAGMREEERWSSAMLADLDVMGVQAFQDNAWTLRTRVRTLPSQRWPVQRELNRRVKYKFDELGVQSPITSYRAQGWLPPGAALPAPAAAPTVAAEGVPP